MSLCVATLHSHIGVWVSGWMRGLCKALCGTVKVLDSRCTSAVYLPFRVSHVPPVDWWASHDSNQHIERVVRRGQKGNIRSLYDRMSKMTHTAHDEDGGDNQAVEDDGCHNGNPDQQTVNSFFFFFFTTSFPLPAFGLVVWRKQAGHIQWTWSVSFREETAALWYDTFLEKRSLYPPPAVESTDCCTAWPSEAGKWPPPRTSRHRGCCRLPCRSRGGRCRSRWPPSSLCRPVGLRARTFRCRWFLHSGAVRNSWWMSSHWGRGPGRPLQRGPRRYSHALRRRRSRRRRTGTLTL